jgi:serine/threonine protein kinase
VAKDLPCESCRELFYKDPEASEEQKFCNNDNHIFCKSCYVFMKECPMCKSKEIRQSSQGNKEEKLKISKDKINQFVAKIPKISSTELEHVTRGVPCAAGSYADIFLCKMNGSFIALKQLRNRANKNQTYDIQREAALCFQVQHPNIVTLLGLILLENDYVGFVMEWADQGNLRENMGKMSAAEKIKVSLCICKGLDYMHSIPIAHRDLKPENVLLFGDRTIAKISDFGTSKIIQTIIVGTRTIGTFKYAAPETMLKGIQVK